jgi:hypothetical protein
VRDADYPSLTPQDLAAVGQALYGAAWRAELARALEASEKDIVMVESGRVEAPAEWRAKLIALAQDLALRALEAANNLLWREGDGADEGAARASEPQAPLLV